MHQNASDEELARLASAVGRALEPAGLRLALAESCTGGWVAQTVTAIAGSSAWFERGFVTYSNEAKQEMLDVPAEVLVQHGAVSEAVVRAMVLGTLNHSRADVALAITGIAGPSGGSSDKPVGTVWFGWLRRGGAPLVQRHQLAGDRAAVRRQSVAIGLDGLLNILKV